MTRLLVVTADDFGRSPGINRGTARAHEHGIVTSASLMVRWPSVVEAAVYAGSHPELGVGLHVDLGEWVFRDGSWAAAYEVVPTNDPVAVRGEVERQLERFHALTGREPTHLDSHQHVHREQPACSILEELGDRLGIPVRASRIPYVGAFYGQTGTGEPLPGAVGVEHLVEILRQLPEGVSELGCHPGNGTDPDSPYNGERAAETRTLCDPRVRRTLLEERIGLCSFERLASDADRQPRTRT